MRPKEEPGTAAAAKDPDRFFCPYPACNRSFAELWRLKVHYRAPPDVRGSGESRAPQRHGYQTDPPGPAVAHGPSVRAVQARSAAMAPS
jgi:hypothetical protein